MGIDINRLSPWAQKQVLAKYRAELAKRGVPKPQDGRSGNRKYNNTPADRQGAEGVKIRFDSQKEARRYDELMLRLKANRIQDLKLQPQFTLQEAYTTADGKRVRAIRYQADFSYFDCDRDMDVVEDVKSKATKTRVYAIKKKLMLEKFGIEIEEIE